jgi:hypothetical protein
MKAKYFSIEFALFSSKLSHSLHTGKEWGCECISVQNFLLVLKIIFHLTKIKDSRYRK